jgi:hypothetical protein
LKKTTQPLAGDHRARIVWAAAAADRVPAFAFHDKATCSAGLLRKILVRDVGLAKERRLVGRVARCRDDEAKLDHCVPAGEPMPA